MPCQRIIFHAFQSVQSIAVTRRAPELENLLDQLLARNSLSQLELDDFHVLRAVENTVRIQLLHKDAQTPKTQSGDDRKEQGKTNETEDR